MLIWKIDEIERLANTNYNIENLKANFNMKTVDQIYQSISNSINNVIAENFNEAMLHIEVIGEMVSFTGTYITPENEKKQIDVDEFDFELTFDLLELKNITTSGNGNKWNKAVFQLSSEGKFTMEFIWDQDFQDEIERLSRN